MCCKLPAIGRGIESDEDAARFCGSAKTRRVRSKDSLGVVKFGGIVAANVLDALLCAGGYVQLFKRFGYISGALAWSASSYRATRHGAAVGVFALVEWGLALF